MTKLLSFAIQLIFISTVTSLDRADPLDCPQGTLAYGLTISVPQSVFWKDPDLRQTPALIPTPLSVCILCHKIPRTDISGIDSDTNREVETISTPNDNEVLPSYQFCVGKGDLTRTVTQTFDCFEATYLKSISKPVDEFNATFGCGDTRLTSSPDANASTDYFISEFVGAGSRARSNWRDLGMNVSCSEKNEFLCGVEIYMDGKAPLEQQKTAEFQEDFLRQPADPAQFREGILDLQRGPQFNAKCCNIYQLSGRPVLGDKYELAQALTSRAEASVIGLAIGLAIATLALLICAANFFCCPCMKQWNKKGKLIEEHESDYKKSDSRDNISDGRQSVFTTRPNTSENMAPAKISVLNVLPKDEEVA